jgi:hypothetical protein
VVIPTASLNHSIVERQTYRSWTHYIAQRYIGIFRAPADWHEL